MIEGTRRKRRSLGGLIPRMPVLVALMTVVAVPGLATAQETGPGSRNTTSGRDGEGSARWSVGVALISAPRPYVGTDRETRVIPLIEFDSGRWFVQGIRAGYRFVDTPRFRLDARVAFRFSGLDPDSSPFLEGMHERRETLVGGIGMEWVLAHHDGARFTAQWSALSDLLGRSDGFASSLDLSWQKVLARGKVILAPAFGVVYQDADHVGYYYGVRADEQRPWRPAYEGDSVVNPRASMVISWRLHGPWSLIGISSFEWLDDPIQDSPVVDRDHELFFLLGASYSF